MIVDDQAEQLTLNTAVQDIQPTDDQNKTLHKTVEAVTRDTDSLSFNTAIARLMEFVNFFTKEKSRPIVCMRQFVLLLSPYAPHIAEELWGILGNNDSLAYEKWPRFDEKWTKDATIEIPVQIKGKVRTKITVDADLNQEELIQTAQNSPNVKQLIDGKEVIKVIAVPGRLINFVVK